MTVLSRYWRWPVYLVGTLLLLLALLLGLAGIVLNTEAGSRRVVPMIVERLDADGELGLTLGTIGGTLFSGLALTDVSLQAGGNAIALGRVDASWNPWSLLGGQFQVSALSLGEVRVAPVAGAAPTQAAEVDLVAQLQLPPLPVAVIIDELRLTDFLWGEGDGQVALESLQLALNWQGQELQVDDLQLRMADLQVESALRMTFAGDVPLLATINWDYQGEAIAPYALAEGNIALTGTVLALTVEQELLAPFPLHSSGTVTLPADASDVSLRFTHTSAQLDLPADLQAYSLRELRLLTTLENGQWRFEADSDVASPLTAVLRVAASGQADSNGMQLDDLTITTPGGGVQASGRVDWRDGLTGSAVLALNETAPLSLLDGAQQWALNDLDAQGSVEFAWSEALQRVDVQLNRFSARAEDYRVLGTGGLQWLDGVLAIDDLSLTTQDNEVRLSGTYAETLAIDWVVNAPRIDQFLAGATGSAIGLGAVRGTVEAPEINGSLEVTQLRVPGLALETLQLQAAGVLEAMTVNARVLDMEVGSGDTVTAVESATLAVQGSLQDHRIDLSLASNLFATRLRLQGGLPSLDDPTWRGTLQSGEISGTPGAWVLDAPHGLTLAAESAATERSCWRHDDTTACLTATPLSADRWSVSGSLRGFALSEFNRPADEPGLQFLPRLPRGISLAGTAEASVTGELGGDAAPALDFSVTTEGMQLALEAVLDEELEEFDVEPLRRVYDWQSVQLQGQLQGGVTTVQTSARVSQSNVELTDLDLNGSLDGELRLDADQALSGRLLVDFQDLGWSEAFLPGITGITGSLRGELGLAGTLQQPTFDGNLGLSGAAATVTALGVSLTDIDATVTSSDLGQVDIRGRMRSGEGELEYRGQITELNTPRRRLQASVDGDNFELVNLENLALRLSPDLDVTADANAIDLQGALAIPRLDLILRELPATAIDVSRDAVVVNYPEDRPDLARSIAAQQSTLFDIPVLADVSVTLGDEVSVSGFGFNADVIGELQIQQHANGNNLTYGELELESGTYELYSTSLTLDQGQLLFLGAYDNPALDMRAVRHVEDLTVGVQINGTLKNMRSRLFSSPALADNDIIAVLVTGRPASEMRSEDGDAVLSAIANLGLDRGQSLTGQIRDGLGLDTLAITNTGNINNSILTIGKYLTPRVFVRYGVGLFDSESKVTIDYTVTERITLQAESGEYQSIDLTYKVER